MNVKLFCHSLVSDWNHGNAHFLRGVMRELHRRGNDIDVLEPSAGESQMSNSNGVESTGEYAEAFGAPNGTLKKVHESIAAPN